jgi:hypothetical protein
MSVNIILVEPRLAAIPAKPTQDSADQIWMATSGMLLLALIGLGVHFKLKVDKLMKLKRFEEYKNRELNKKLKMALNTIAKMEKNPDLVHSREFNLDYLRLRMDEEQFHFAILNQIKIRVKERLSVALRPHQAEEGTLGIASVPRQVDEIFDVVYDLPNDPQGVKRVLFRIQIKIAKLPSQSSSATVQQIIDCMEKYMSHAGADESWQPTIQGRIVYMHWDQKAKPTPLLVLEQSNEGVNVTFRTQRMVVSQ